MPTSGSNVYLTHDATRIQNKEDILDMMRTVDTRDDNPLVKDLDTTTAVNNAYHEWTYFTRARSTGNVAVTEGDDFSYNTLTNPVRTINFVETIDETFNISDDQEGENTVGGSEVQKRKKDALRSLMASIEREGIFGSGASGASNTARVMKGILSLLSKSTNASKATVTEANFLTYLQEVDRETTMSTPLLYCDIAKKLNIDTFTQGVTRNVDASEKRQINYITVVETTFGVIELYRHRDLVGTGRMFIIDKDSFRWAFKKRPYFIEPAPQGHYVRGVYSTKVTMEALNPLAGISVLNP